MGTTAGQMMSRRVAVVEPDATCLTVWEYLSRTDAGLVAVVDDIGRVHGIVSPSDIALAWLRRSRDLRQITVLEILDDGLRPRVGADASVHRVARVMLDSQRDALPVLDTDGTLTGVVTHRDILAAVAREGEEEPRPTPASDTIAHLVP